MKKNEKILLIIAIFMSVLIFSLFCGFVSWIILYPQFSGNRDGQLGVPIYSIEDLRGNFELLWAKTDLESTIPSNRNNLTAANNKLYLITEGKNKDVPSMLSLRAMNANTGQIEWQIEDEFGLEISHNQHHLFVENHRGISSYTLDSGFPSWSNNSVSGGIVHMMPTNTELFITTGTDKTFALDTVSGKMVDSLSFPDVVASLFMIEDSKVFWQRWPTSLLASDVISGEIIWEHSFEGGFKKTPIFAGDMIFVVTFEGQLVSINKDSGEILWSTPKPDSLLFSDRVVSNIAIDNGVLYYLSQDSQLRAVNVIDGSLIDQVSFSPSLFELDEHYNRHRFDVTADNGIVAVHFGDSFQLFVFHFQYND